jgi:hypothetical protein
MICNDNQWHYWLKLPNIERCHSLYWLPVPDFGVYSGIKKDTCNVDYMAEEQQNDLTHIDIFGENVASLRHLKFSRL